MEMDEGASGEVCKFVAATNNAKPTPASAYTYCFIDNYGTRDGSPGGKSMDMDTQTFRGQIHCLTLAAKLVFGFGLRLVWFWFDARRSEANTNSPFRRFSLRLLFVNSFVSYSCLVCVLYACAFLVQSTLRTL